MNKVNLETIYTIKLTRRSRNIKRKQRRTNKEIKRYSKRRMSKERMTKRINQSSQLKSNEG